jgi:restriction system protein
MLPLLQAFAHHDNPIGIKDLIKPLAHQLNLGEADVAQRLPSGRQGIFHNRLHWAKFYMTKAGLLTGVERGKSRITPSGLELLAKAPAKISNATLAQYPSFNEFIAASKAEPQHPRKAAGASGTTLVLSGVDSATPEERIEAARRDLEQALQAELLDRVRAMDDSAFEQLIVELLLKMGYGQGAEELARALGGSGDGGIDGVVPQDPLGLDRVYIQAKRWKEGNAVGPKDIRDFNGALDIKRSPKGLFVTASSFTKEAESAASNATLQIVLINGEELARLMVRHRVGTRVRGAVEIVAVDDDFFTG